MIKECIHDDIIKSPFNNIVFAVNSEGLNDGGFAGFVSKNFWAELENTGGNKLGDVLVKNVKKDENDLTGKTFYAIVCHSLENGWSASRIAFGDALRDKIPNNPCAIVKIGAGLIGLLSGAPVAAIMKVMAEAKQELTIYSL